MNESLKEENQQLKTQIAKLTEIIGVLPSNHSVGNLGYRIKNQRHEINNRLKEIDKLKKLLKECFDWFTWYQIDVITGRPYIEDWKKKGRDLQTKIDNAIREK